MDTACQTTILAVSWLTASHNLPGRVTRNWLLGGKYPEPKPFPLALEVKNAGRPGNGDVMQILDMIARSIRDRLSFIAHHNC